MKVRLAYGKKGLEWNIPDNCHVDVIEPRWTEGKTNQLGAVREALLEPINSSPLRKLAGKDDKIGIIFSDITRATPYNILLPALFAEMDHIPAENITLFCATGTHRPCTDKELDSILGEEVVNNFRIVQNDTNDESLFSSVGQTGSGNNIRINKEVLACDLKIFTGFIEPHFFMGFSGGGKAVMPGMGYLETIRFNHSIAMLENENARWGITEGNPLWEDVMEAAEMIPGIFLLNITLNKNKVITGVFAGELRTAHEAGCKFAKETAMMPLDKEYDIVVTSNSGYPLDLNIYQSVKGMSAAAQIVRQGGVIITAAECWDGIPSGSDYERILSSADSIDELSDYIRKHENTLQDTWQVFFQVIIQQRAKVYLFTDKLEDSVVSRTLLHPVSDPESLIEELVGLTGNGTRICILPEGPQTIPYIRGSNQVNI
jgi:lactate racemase